MAEASIIESHTPSESTRESVNEFLYRGNTSYGADLQAGLNGRLSRLLDYMSVISKGQPDNRLVSPEMANKALRAWANIWRASGFAVPVPDAAPAEDGHMVFVWDHSEHYLEMEVFEDGRCELFYRNRQSEALWGEDYPVSGPVPSELLNRLRILR